jgi:hypothetical protein
VTKNCPTCGQLLPPANPFAPKSPIKARIYEFIAKHPEGATRDQVASYAYADDPDGGATSLSIVSVHIMQMNKQKLRSLGCVINSTMGHGAVYRLVAL